MTTEELKRHVLRGFYDLKKGDVMIAVNKIPEFATEEPQLVLDACMYLEQDKLLEWKSARSGRTGAVDFGLGRITSMGIKLIDGELSSPEYIIVHDRSTHLHNSPGAIIGSGNVQNINVGKIVSAIDDSSVSEIEKKEAKSLLEKVLTNRVLWAALATILPSGSAH
jgi:hypothetical protein